MADMPPHLEPHPDVAGYVLGALTEEEAARFAQHLAGCAVCRDELDALDDLPDLLAAMVPDDPLPDDLEARTFEAIERAAADLDATPEDWPAPIAPSGGDEEDSPGGVAEVVSLGAARAGRSARSSRTSGRRRTPWLIAAAAAVVIIAIGVAIPKLQSHGAAPLATVALVAPDGGPAHGKAVVRAAATGLTINLAVADLKPSPPGTFYTCWLVGRGDTLAHQNRVSVGSFVVGAGGTADVNWATGDNLKRFPTVGVTLEPQNGDPLHQGPKVLEAA
jgi:anti-sigma-K factor RskA